ncbi:DNA-directed RNA polymerase II subunit RPB11-b1 [Gonapodya sp. JEL0774]|nr:DNA-directed RNA polymerase II subunit RPB11-b1 [Gonapodya sp. JEL0774]
MPHHFRVIVTRDTKIPNAATFTIYTEDHTVGNVLRQQLLRNPRVLFAGYRVPHPLEPKVEIKVQTTHQTTPVKVLVDDMVVVIRTTENLFKKFETACTAAGATRTMDIPSVYGVPGGGA